MRSPPTAAYDAAILAEIAGTPGGLTVDRLEGLMALRRRPCSETAVRGALRRLLKRGKVRCRKEERERIVPDRPALKRGRPALPGNIPELIRQMDGENPTWGEERIANELSLKLGLRVSPRTVHK